MAEFEVLGLLQYEKWSQFLQALPVDQQDIYFSPQYYQLYEEIGDGIAKCFVFKKGSSLALYPFLLNSVNKLGFSFEKEYFDIQGAYGYNGVISNNYSKEFQDNFFRCFNIYCLENSIIAEFTRFHPLINNYKFSADYINCIFDRKTVFIDLYHSLDDIISNFSSSNKRAIKKAKQSGLEVRYFEKEFPFKEEFKLIYKETMERVNSSEYLFFSPNYFDLLFNIPKTTQFVCFFNNQPIASSVCLLYGDYFHYHLGASKTDFLNLRPNNLLFQEMINYAGEKGYKTLHFGGGVTNNIEDALLRFKTSFSNTTSDFYIGKKIHNELIYTQVVKQWEEKYPEKADEYQKLLLKYRF